MYTFFKSEQAVNASLRMLVTDLGMETLSTLPPAPANALDAMPVTV